MSPKVHRPHCTQHDISNVLIDDEDLREEFAKYDPDGNGWVTKAAFLARCREFASFGPADTEERIKEMLQRRGPCGTREIHVRGGISDPLK